MGLGSFSITLPAAAPGALRQFARDLDDLFEAPRPFPPLPQRAAAVIAQIDWSADTIILWIPGTNDGRKPVHPKLLEALGARAKHLKPVSVPYMSTWQMCSSIPDGTAALREVLLEIAKRRRRGQRIVLVGESQGSEVIGEVLADPLFGPLIDRASMISHPGMAPQHAHETKANLPRLPASAREFNDSNDLVSRDTGRNGQLTREAVDAFADLRVGTALGIAGRMALSDPKAIAALIKSQLFRFKGEVNPHDSSDKFADAVEWALS